MTDEDDHDLMRAWREGARETPGDLLDRRVLAVARAQVARRRALPLGLAMAACLVLALYAARPRPTPAPAPEPAIAQLDPATVGLYEGRTFAAADAAEARPVMLRHAPALTTTPTAFSP